MEPTSILLEVTAFAQPGEQQNRRQLFFFFFGINTLSRGSKILRQCEASQPIWDGTRPRKKCVVTPVN